MAPAACPCQFAFLRRTYIQDTYTAGGKVASHPLGVAITLPLVGEHRLEGVTEGEVQGLGGEVTDDVGSVASPEGDGTLSSSGAAEAVNQTAVLAVETASLKHLILYSVVSMLSSDSTRQDQVKSRKFLAARNSPAWNLLITPEAESVAFSAFADTPVRLLIAGGTNLVLDEELDTLNGGGSSLGDGSGNTTH